MEILRYDTGATMSRVTEVNGLLFFSGHVAAQGETMEEQANALFARIYMPDIAQKEEFNAVWDKWITPGCAPARVCVQAGLGDTPYRMEISVIAAKVE